MQTHFKYVKLVALAFWKKKKKSDLLSNNNVGFVICYVSIPVPGTKISLKISKVMWL